VVVRIGLVVMPGRQRRKSIREMVFVLLGHALVRERIAPF
jgi:hypothetical protein